MINKLFSLHRRRSNNLLGPKPNPTQSRAVEEEQQSLALKIVHVGGRAECYYMAVPAARIMEKYPSFVLARPDVFKRPWEAVVRPEEVLVPGQKILVVPRSTVKKLRRKIMRQTSKKTSEPHLEDDDDGVLGSKSKSGIRRKRVSFIGIDSGSDSSSSLIMEVNHDNKKGKSACKKIY